MLNDMNRDLERRVLFVAPTKRDEEVTCSLLRTAGLACVACAGLRELACEVPAGAGVILLTEEAALAPGMEDLLAMFGSQPPWSDLAIVLLMRGGVASPSMTRALQSLSNVTLLERPASTRSVVSAVRAAVRSRERQYHIREQMEAVRRAEATARELRRQLEIAIDASELGTFHCEIPLRHILWNDRCKAHFWLPPHAVVDFDLFYSLLHEDDRERTRLAVEACVYGGQVFDVEYRTVSPEGEIRWVRGTGRTSCDEHGQPVQFDGTTQDITYRKRAEEALQEADRRKDEFLATLAHELRNPLAPIRNSLHLLRLSGDLSPSLESVRDIMERQVDHMVRLVDDLLDVSRIAHGKIELRKETIELATIVARVLEAIRPIIDAAGHQLAISLPAEPIVLEADPLRLSQMLGNLLNNAAKYTTEGGQIWLTARSEAGEAVISVRDTGLGIPADMLPKVFDLFTQVDRTLTRAQGGLGIGLTLTKSFVELHGGRIEAHSDGPGRGSEFIVRLPVLRDFQRRRVLEAPISKDHAPMPCLRILVVDDTRAAGYILCKLLEKLGQQVRFVDHAAAALESVRRERPDLVISDVAMPIMDGYELARRLRTEPGMEDLKLAALTGYGQASDRQLAEEAGFNYHLVKPVSLEAIEMLLTQLPAPPTRSTLETTSSRSRSPG